MGGVIPVTFSHFSRLYLGGKRYQQSQIFVTQMIEKDGCGSPEEKKMLESENDCA